MRLLSVTKRQAAALTVVLVTAVAVRALFFKYETGDFSTFYSWYEFIRQHGGLTALRYNFANYNEPYLYLLALVAYLPVPALVGIKLIAVSFDFLLAYFTYRTVRLKYPIGGAPVAATSAVLLLPTVVLNSAWWGQVDASYTALALGGIYFTLRRRPWWACTFFGLALAFKLQAIFIFPLLALLVLRRHLQWRQLLAVPMAFIALDIPAFLVGASVSTLWSTYYGQVGQYPELTLHAPNIYQYLGAAGSGGLRTAGIIVTLAIVTGLIAWAAVRRVELSPTTVVLAATVSALVLPFLLPAMHERYFYMADILTVIAAFFLPKRLWALPVLEQFASVMSYMPFLLATTTTGSLNAGAATRGNGTPQAAPAGGGPSGFGRAFGGAALPRSSVGRGQGSSSHQAPGALAGLSGHTVVNFQVLSTVMLAALVLALFVAITEMGRGRAARAPVLTTVAITAPRL